MLRQSSSWRNSITLRKIRRSPTKIKQSSRKLYECFSRTGFTLERNILVRDRPRRSRFGLGSTLVEVVAAARSRGRSARTARKIASATALAASTEQNQIVNNNFCHIFFLARGLVI